MDGNKPVIGAICSVVPGLGQVYCGQNLRGFLLCLGTFITGMAAILIWMGFGGLFGMPGDALFLLPLAVWVFAAWDAYLICVKMEAGELPSHEPRLLQSCHKVFHRYPTAYRRLDKILHR